MAARSRCPRRPSTALGDRIPDGTRLVSVGPRRLKDFEDPRPLHLLVVPGAADDDRPLRTIDAPTNLPTPPTTFVGREDDLATLGSTLMDARLLTLTGPGGTGKTRLGLRLAAAVADRFPGGTWFVDLAAVRDPGLVHSTIAAALDLREEPGVPIARTLQAHLQPLTSLLVLDNLEQLLPTAATDVAGLIRAAPGLRVIVTSRERLRVAGEHEFAVPPLDPAGGVTLFVDRAPPVRPDAIDDRRRARGRPRHRRATRGAAARHRAGGGPGPDVRPGGHPRTPRDQPGHPGRRRARPARTPADPARRHRLEPRPPDARRAGDLPALRRLRRRLGRRASRRTSWTRTPPSTCSSLDGLEALSDKSLVKIRTMDQGEPRFERHTLLGEFAGERLDRSGERPDCERRHAMAFLDLAEEAGPYLTGSDAAPWMDRLRRDQPNLRAAMRWSLTADEPEVGLRIIAAAWRFWQLSSQLAEGAAWASELLAHPLARTVTRGSGSGRSRRRAGSPTGRTISRSVGRPTRSACDWPRSLGDDLRHRRGHYDLGFMGVTDQDIAFLQEHETIALEIFERIGLVEGVVRARQALVLVNFLRGDYAEARALEELNLVEFERFGAAPQGHRTA